MATNANLARIFGSDLDAISLAPFGTLLPITIDEPLAAGFEDVGWLGPDGITESLTGSVEKKRGHQGAGVIRTRVSEPGTTVSFVAFETKAQTLGLRYVEKTVTSTLGVRHATRSSGQKVTKMSCVVDLFDADNTSIKERYVIGHLDISSNGDRVAIATDIAGLPFLGDVIGDYDHFATEVEADAS